MPHKTFFKALISIDFFVSLVFFFFNVTSYMKEAFNVFVDNDGIIILFYFEINILAG